ncbi:MAG: type II secretion system minor pseudopilin GspK [Proteobacteria bacterium]|nr:type II secretion system minor pseudopilin GspK [Pseudomonadota bacterium]
MSARRRRHRSPPSLRAQRGMALIIAILIVALGTMVAAVVASENAMTARKGTAVYAFDQSVLVAQGAEAIAAYGLRQIVQGSPKALYLGQGWDKPLGPIEVMPGMMLEATLEDLQGRFNLNNLVNTDGTPDPVMVNAFNALLAHLGLEQKWTGYIVDWIDMDGIPSTPEGAEDSVYMGQTVPYRTPNRYITSTSELLALPGFGYDRYQVLAPFVAALPHGSKINVCTAHGVILDSFISADHTEFSNGNNEDQLTKNRQNAGGCFPTLTAYQAAFSDPKTWLGTGTQTTTAGQTVAAGSLGTQNGVNTATQGTPGVGTKFVQTSNYFRLTSTVSIGSTEFNVYSLLYQDSQAQMVRPIQRSFTPD